MTEWPTACWLIESEFFARNDELVPTCERMVVESAFREDTTPHLKAGVRLYDSLDAPACALLAAVMATTAVVTTVVMLAMGRRTRRGRARGSKTATRCDGAPAML